MIFFDRNLKGIKKTEQVCAYSAEIKAQPNDIIRLSSASLKSNHNLATFSDLRLFR